MTCHCGGILVDHDTFAPKRDGAFHCFTCGCCFLPDGRTHREGVPKCAQAGAGYQPEQAVPPPSEQETAPATTPPNRRRKR
jgi:hypothetical protein